MPGVFCPVLRRFGAGLLLMGLLGPPAAARAESSEPKVASETPPSAATGGVRGPRKGGALKPLPQALASLDAWVRAQSGQVSALFVDTGTGRELAASSADTPLNPASNQKVLVAAAALATLGPNYRFTTGVYGLVEEGAVGPLVLRGNGDPSLQTADFWRLADALSKLDVNRVKGPLLVDQQAFDDRFVPPAFEQQPDEWAAFRAPVSAVAVQGNSIVVQVKPTSPGEPAKVWVTPEGFVELEGKVMTVPSGKRSSFDLVMKPKGERLVVTLSGTVTDGKPQAATRRVDDPRLMPGYVLKGLLIERKISVADGVALGGAGEARPLFTIQSEPLSRLLLPLGKNSNNFYAEMLLKALGRTEASGVGTSEGGVRMICQWLKDSGLWLEGTQLSNGSGLFDANRVSARLLVNLLVHTQQQSDYGAEFLNHLAVGGRDGTLRSRFTKKTASGKVRAKTGTLAGVDSLSGYIVEGGRPRVAFSIIVNGTRDRQKVRRLIDSVVESALQGGDFQSAVSDGDAVKPPNSGDDEPRVAPID